MFDAKCSDLLKKHAGTMEFIYLQPPKYPKTAEFDPYELEIVTYGEIDSPYHYTMSAQGVTLFRDNDAGTHSFPQTT
jgi:hypothetical protein